MRYVPRNLVRLYYWEEGWKLNLSAGNEGGGWGGGGGGGEDGEVTGEEGVEDDAALYRRSRYQRQESTCFYVRQILGAGGHTGMRGDVLAAAFLGRNWAHSPFSLDEAFQDEMA